MTPSVGSDRDCLRLKSRYAVAALEILPKRQLRFSDVHPAHAKHIFQIIANAVDVQGTRAIDAAVIETADELANAKMLLFFT